MSPTRSRPRRAFAFAGFAGLAALAGLVVWSVFASPPGGRTAAPLEPLPGEVAGAEIPAPAIQPAEQVAPVVPGASDSPSASARQDSTAGEALEAAASVVFPGGRPAAGASVVWFSSADLSAARWRIDLEELGLSRDFLERNGRRFVADEQGIARLPADRGRAQVVAMLAEGFAMSTLDAGLGAGEVVRLELRTAISVEVRLRASGEGAPLGGVLVAAECALLPQSRVAARTDERGSAVLWPLFSSDDPRFRWRAVVEGAFLADVRAPLVLEPGAAPVELDLPPCAPCSVRLVDARGALRPVEGTLELGWNDADGDPREPRAVAVHGGVANLGHVEQGVVLYARARPTGESRSETAIFEQRRTGPARQTFDLVVPAPEER